MSVVIELPMPTFKLSANGRKKLHFREESKLTKQYRELAYIIALSLKRGDMPWEVSKVSTKFFFKTPTKELDAKGTRRDQENFMVAIKPYYDGLVDAGISIDDDWAHMKKVSPDLSGCDRKNPHVELTIERMQ